MQKTLRHIALVLTIYIITGLLSMNGLFAQCSICTRTAQQLGEKPAQGLNAGIMYLAFTPLAIFGFVAYTWWKRNKA